MSIYPITPCPRCRGTGRDSEKTEKAGKSGQIDEFSWVRCSLCNGNGVW